MNTHRFTRPFALALCAASLLAASPSQAKYALKAAPKVPLKTRALSDAPEMTMNRARVGIGELKLGADTFALRSATLILMPKTRMVQVAFETTRGRLLLVGTATRWDNDTVMFSLTRAGGPLSRALGAQGRSTGEVKGQAQLSDRKRSFSAISLDGKIGARTVSASFRSSALPVRSAPIKKR